MAVTVLVFVAVVVAVFVFVVRVRVRGPWPWLVCLIGPPLGWGFGVALNIGEAEYSDGGNRRARFHAAAGSANEVGMGLEVAVAFGYVPEPRSAKALHLVDRALAILWKLNGPPGE